MKSESPFQSVCKNPGRVCLRGSLLALGMLLVAADVKAEEMPNVAASTTVRMSGRTVTFQRLEPPKQWPQPAAVPTAATQVSADAVKQEHLSLSCTVYSGGLTEVRWQSALGECRILSSVNFNFLRNAGPVSEAGRTWSTFMAVGRPMPPLGTRRSLAHVPIPRAPADVPLQTAEGLHQPGPARYAVLSAPAGAAEAGAFTGIDALHHYFDANQAGLVSIWRELEYARMAQERQQALSPPREPDAVIQFWPKRGSRYLQPPAKGGAQPASSSGKEGQ